MQLFIRNVSALEVLCNLALQIDIYLLLYTIQCVLLPANANVNFGSEFKVKCAHFLLNMLPLLLCRTLQRSSALRCSEWTRIKRFVRSLCFRRTTLSSRALTSSRLNQLISGQETHYRSLFSWPLRSPPTHRRLLPGQYSAV